MDYLRARRCMKRVAAACFLSGALILTSCDQFTGEGNREAQFLARRVEALEKKIGELEGEIDRLRAGVPARIEGNGGTEGSGLSGGPAGLGAGAAMGKPDADSSVGLGGGAVAISNQPAENLKSDVDRANILVLKAKQMEGASRNELPQLISSLGIIAPEVDGLKAQIRKLEDDRLRMGESGGTGSPEATAVEAELEKLRFRLELVCEGVRKRVLDDGREASAWLQATSEGGTDEAQAD